MYTATDPAWKPDGNMNEAADSGYPRIVAVDPS